MAKLKPGFGRLASLGELSQMLMARLPVLGTEEVSLSEALHRVTAEDVRAAIDVPHFAKAAMDGFAVRAQDTFGASDAQPAMLAVVESVMPGTVPSVEVIAGSCTEIGTGAPMPQGADAVVMVENTEPEDDRVSVRRPVAPGENVVPVASDIASGSVVVGKGMFLQPRHLGVIAAVGMDRVSVVRRPRVALFSTGPEIVPAGSDLSDGQIYDINTYTLRAALTADGAEVIDMGIVEDEVEPLESALTEAVGVADLVLLSGGSSLGGGDLVEMVFARVGTMLVHGVAVKPGKPVVVGSAKGSGGEKLMIGLPGYPMSALSDYYLFVQPLLSRAVGASLPEPRFVQARLSRKHASTVGRYEFLPVRLEEGSAVPLTKGSSAITALADADGFVEIDENTEVVEAGSPVQVRLF